MHSCDFNWQARAGEIKKRTALVRAEFNVLGVRCIICIPVRRYVSSDEIAMWPSFFSVLRHKYVDQLGDARLAEFFEFQLITRCKRERREIYVPRFVRRNASRGLGLQVHRAITQYFQLRIGRRNASARALGRARTSHRYVFISHTRISVRTEFRKLRGPCSCQLTDISRLGFPLFREPT